ncbi:MAG TPA: hypothetical protein VK212_09990 [Lentimicrobium sp.]|nr:hypothetical protein [Lentimicrobium sp.]
MKSKLLLPCVVAIVALMTTSCYNDSEEALYPAGCDTTNVSYSQTIQPILSQNCNSCHNSTENNAGVITENYNDLITHVNSGIFWKAVNHETGVVPMPFEGQKLQQCDLDRIKAWIDNGAPNN